ncbi:hypothetical protein BH23GEM10_BH23GEM10_07270 [soil metagenome]
MLTFRTVVTPLLASALAAAIPHAPEPLGAVCPDPVPGSAAPDPDLYCMTLVPAPDFRAASGAATLMPAESPFGVAVTRDGSQIYDVTVSVDGLPSAADLGTAAYIAWATTPRLTPWIRLGTVSAGSVARGRVDFDKFMIFVSAEPDTTVMERTGTLVLRGTSPSMRMMPMDDPVLLMGAASADHAHHTTSDGWIMPPHDTTLFMPPGMMSLRPSVTPFLPDTSAAVGDPVAIPHVRPRELMRLRDGDSISLTAGLVRRTVGGKPVIMYGFNGQQPGPLLHVEQGARITVDFRNELDLPTAVHWHGVRLDNRFDGVPHVTQEPVAPGASFRYEVHFRDAGIYWYHPHHREDIQQDLGLYGNMLVDPIDRAAYNPVHREEVLILDDLLIADEGLVPYGREAATDALMGRFGNMLLVNGAPDYTMDVVAGDVVRLYLTNASNTRTFNASFDGARIKLIGSDLSRFEREEWVESVVLAPAERYIVEVRFDEPGATAMINRVRAIDHVAGSFMPLADTLMRINVRARNPVDASATATLDAAIAGQFEMLRDHDDVASEIDRYRAHFDRPVDHHLTFGIEAIGLPRTIELMMRDDSAYFHPVEWHGTMAMMSWVSSAREVRWILREAATGRENMDVTWRFRVGDVVRIRLTNERRTIHAMQHPIHIHGQRFLVISRNGVPTGNLVWKDTLLVPAGQTADVLLELSNPGRWMLHCHIAEHMEAGMMMVFDVADANEN